VAGGLVRGTLGRTDLIGAEAIQVFVANPRGWAEPAPDPDGDAAFAQARADRGLAVFVHAPYLINFGSPAPETLRRSRDALAFSLRRAAAIGATAVVVHAGSAVLGNQWTDAMAQVRTNLIALLDAAGPAGPRLLIEPTAGGGGALASDIASIGAYLDVLDDDRIGLCIDTCHLHAAGHDLSNAAGMRSAFTRLRRTVGAGRIGLLHVNDSRDPPGSKRDRHAPLGQGTIGLAAFEALLGIPAIRGIALVVETDDGGHAGDIATLKTLRDGGAGRPQSDKSSVSRR
jgi:deoxyribonuclease-4